MEEKNVKIKKKGTKLIVFVTIGVLLVMLLGMQVFASVKGYGNVFFMVKELVNPTQQVIGADELFSDKEITLSFKSINIADGLSIQVSKLEISENGSTLCLNVNAQKNTVLPLTYSIKSNKLKETDVNGTGNSSVSTYNERLTVKHKFEDDDVITLYVKDKNGKVLKEIEINLQSHEILIKGEEEVQKISQVELKKYLSAFSELNNGSKRTSQLIKIGYNLLAINTEEERGDATGIEEINKGIKEFYGDKASFEKVKSESGKDFEVLKSKDGSKVNYSLKSNIYMLGDEFDGYKEGICLRIADINYKDGIYTVDFIYTLATEEEKKAEKIEELPQYEATIKLKRNENAEISKYEIIELSEGKVVEEGSKVDTEVSQKVSKAFERPGKYYYDKTDFKADKNGMVAIVEGGEEQFKTEIKDGYYIYKDGWNEYYIKDITLLKSEFVALGKSGDIALFKCTINYIDNKDENKSFDVAIILDSNFVPGNVIGTFDNYTATRSFSRLFGITNDEVTTDHKVEEGTAKCSIRANILESDGEYGVYYFDPDGAYKTAKNVKWNDNNTLTFEVNGKSGKYSLGVVVRNSAMTLRNGYCEITMGDNKINEFTEVEDMWGNKNNEENVNNDQTQETNTNVYPSDEAEQACGKYNLKYAYIPETKNGVTSWEYLKLGDIFGYKKVYIDLSYGGILDTNITYDGTLSDKQIEGTWEYDENKIICHYPNGKTLNIEYDKYAKNHETVTRKYGKYTIILEKNYNTPKNEVEDNFNADDAIGKYFVKSAVRNDTKEEVNLVNLIGADVDAYINLTEGGILDTNINTDLIIVDKEIESGWQFAGTQVICDYPDGELVYAQYTDYTKGHEVLRCEYGIYTLYLEKNYNQN